MKLNKVNIKNFRNIESATYDLQKTNIFTGPNARGKTNTILAIYWALADYLMDGTSDYGSFKPHSDTSAEVSVELVFDNFSFKKTFAEKWVKTRGSSESTMQGHETQYFIDDVKYGVTEGKRLLLDNLGLDSVKSSRVDIVRAVIDPYYLAQGLPWKDLRTFIIDLVGDVDDMSLLDSTKEYELIKEDLIKQKFNVESLTKLYRQNVKNAKGEVKKQETILLGYEAIKDVDAEELAKAEVNLTLIDNDIEALKAQKSGTSNPKVQILESELSQVRVAYAESLNADREHLEEVNKQLNLDIQKLEKEYLTKRNDLADLNNKIRLQKDSLDDYTYQIKLLERDRDSKVDEKERLSDEWLEIDALEYERSLDIQACPHCGGVLNSEALELDKTKWEEDKQYKLDAIVIKGKKLANEIDNLTFQINELKKPEVIDYDTQIEVLNVDIYTIETKLEENRNSLVTEYVSEETSVLKTKGLELKEQLESEKLVKTTEDIDAQIIKKIASKEPYKKVVDDHNAFLAIQEKAKEVETLIDINQNALVSYETKAILLEEFIKTKLTMLKGNVAKVFGDLEFVLIETNIKEGSYNEVCYPLILGKETPFISGSGAEKIITGIYMIERVKDALSLQDLPIIFDEADKLDTHTLINRVVTDSQLISTKVDDINYEKVTLVVK